MRFLFVTFLLLPALVSAQLISTGSPLIEIGNKNFDPEFVRKNKIKHIDIRSVNKPDGAIIIDKGTSYGYTFNEKGYVTQYFYTVFNTVIIDEKSTQNKPSSDGLKRKYINDTIWIDVLYDSLNRVICKRVNTDNIFDSYYYDYNDKNQIIGYTHCRESNANNNPKKFEKGVQTVLSAETYKYYELSPLQIKQECINTSGFPYKQNIISFDSKKNIASECCEFIAGWHRKEYQYAYDSNGRVKNKTVKSNETKSAKTEHMYEYSKSGNILTEKKYVNGELNMEYNYLYDEQSNLVKSEVNRNHKNAVILIVKYKYEFYP
jgi:hypothetical protein